MATPDIGKTITEGYSRALDRLGPIAAAVAVPAILLGIVAAVVSIIQQQMIPSGEEVVANLFSGKDLDAYGTGDLAVINLLSALLSIISTIVMTGVSAVVAGGLHRERHGAALELPSPAESMSAVIAMAQRLMPKLLLLALLGAVGAVVGILSTSLGLVASLAAGIVSIWLTVRWVYAAVIAGSGEAEGDAAYQRSDDAVSGNWWPTFGILIVVCLATILPIAVIAGILGGILGGANAALGAFVMYAILAVGLSAILGSALESAWAQVEGGAGPGSGLDTDMSGSSRAPGTDQQSPAAAPPTVPPTTPPSTPPNDPDAGPFV